MAKRIQKEAPFSGTDQLAASKAESQLRTPPTKKESSAAIKRAMTTNWKRVAQSAPSHAKIKRNATAPAAIS